MSALLVRHASLQPVCGRDFRFGSRETTRAHVQSRHATARSGDQVKRNGDCQKEIAMTLCSVFEGYSIVTGISPEVTFAEVDLTIRGDEVGGGNPPTRQS